MALEQKNPKDWAIKEFVGNNYPYYKTNWENQGSDKVFIRWNWAAFLFPCYWLIYRKMFSYTLFIILAYLLSALIPYSFILIHIFMGCLGNYLYFKKCHQEITAAFKLTRQEAETYIRKKGHTSISAPMILTVSVLLVPLMTFSGAKVIKEVEAISKLSSYNTCEMVSEKHNITINAPQIYENKKSNYDLYLSSYNSELIVNAYPIKEFSAVTWEQNFIDSAAANYIDIYKLKPADKENLLSLPINQPQALYYASVAGNDFYFYFTCKKYGQYYIQTIYTTPPYSWKLNKEAIQKMILSISTKDSP